ncbi:MULTISPECIES: GNAT family N-acetyltransferase [Parabacteroides]|uniref:GNAT family N-acetyltransferase n=1 Tax=Parabacteroides provencensis TaxID=1944636 RepID=UPI000C154893|nr:GNAT family N-acetyltransferase [Parabacteroides provencensis]
MAEDYELIDNETHHQYEFHVDKYIPKIEYIKSKNGEIYLTHTEVPIALEGKGIGSQLVEKVLKDIEKQELRLVPLCPFVAGYLQKHPDWKRIVIRGINIQS